MIHGVSVGLIIPALNEEAALPRVLADVPTGVDEVLVVDNGSTDRTADVARQGGAGVVVERQRGYGAACWRGLCHMPSCDVVAFIDADYSDPPDQLPVLVEPIARDQADFVLASRVLGQRESGAMPIHSLLGNRLACTLMGLLFAASYTDLGPFRAIRRDALDWLAMTDRGFGWTVEMQIKAVRAGLRIAEVPLPTRRRIGVSKISGTVTGSVRAGYRILSTIARYGFFDRGPAPWPRKSPPAKQQVA